MVFFAFLFQSSLLYIEVIKILSEKTFPILFDIPLVFIILSFLYIEDNFFSFLLFFVIGAFTDMVSVAPMGIYTLIFLGLFVYTNWFVSFFKQISFPLFLILCFTVYFFKNVLLLLFCFLFFHLETIYLFLKNTLFIEVISNLILSIFIYLLFQGFVKVIYYFNYWYKNNQKKVKF